MVSAASRHLSITLYSHSNSIYSHLVRFVMSEKNVTFDLIEVDSNCVNKQLLDCNPYGEVPTLVDRDLVIYNPSIILEYLDERYPHPPLMPVFPISRAETRLFLYRIAQDWYSLADKIISNPKDTKSIKDLKETLISTTDAIRSTEFFMSDEFSIIDCYVAPLLWRLPMMNVNLTGSSGKLWQKYMNTLFSKESFRGSLTNDEINQRALVESIQKNS